VQASVHRGVRQLAFYEKDRRPTLNYDKVDLSAVDIAKVEQLQISAAGILFVMDPLEQVGCNQILKPG
jgi:hypothetical protein